jgi:putative restriction endonuclease
VEKLNDISEDELPAEGKTRERLVKTRVNQSFFRSMILADYDGACCITGISERALLVASHIRPWAVDERNRLNPRNGLALNALHDRAFDAGLLTITPDYTILISAALKKRATPTIQRYFTDYDGKSITPPRKFPPDQAFLSYHNEHVFKP